MIDKGKCDDGFIWNPNAYECERDVNCQCRKRLTDRLVDGNEMIYNATLYDYERVSRYCTRYVILLIIVCIVIMGINSVCLYFHLYAKRNYVNLDEKILWVDLRVNF